MREQKKKTFHHFDRPIYMHVKICKEINKFIISFLTSFVRVLCGIKILIVLRFSSMG